MRNSTLQLTLIPAVALGLFAGCSSEPTRYPVTGTVTIDGAPAGHATVKFIPAEPGTDPKHGGLVTADAEGKFSLGEEGKNTGLPAGSYKVAFSQALINGKASVGGSGGKASERLPGETDGVPESYRDPKTTPVTATVGPGSTTFTFEIKKK
jgi:hypothetical protein